MDRTAGQDYHEGVYEIRVEASGRVEETDSRVMNPITAGIGVVYL